MKKAFTSPRTAKSNDERTVSSAEEFLTTEYELLNQRIIHGEDVSHRIFNFYVSLLTAVLGGLVVGAQTFSNNIPGVLIVVSGASGFLILLGIVFFDGLITQYIRNAYCQLGIQSIRIHFRRYSEVSSSLLEPLRLFPEESDTQGKRSLADRMMVVGLGSTISTQLTLIETINSLLIVASVCCLVWGIGGIGFRILDTVFAAIICGCVSLVAHVTLAKWRINHNIAPLQSELNLRVAVKKPSQVDDFASPADKSNKR